VLAAYLTATVLAAAPQPQEWHGLLGESEQGRPIRVHRLGDFSSPRKLLVVGCIHGDECAGIRIADRLLTGRPRHFVDLWVVRNLNPDGSAAGIRQNARGVDLNRNFPFRWKPGPRGRYYPGPRPLSERESRMAVRLARRIDPDVTIWFHQPLALVDRSGGDPRIQRRYARLVGLPFRQLGRFHGTATSWQNHTNRDGTAFVVELPGGPLRPKETRRFADAVFELARSLG